MEEIINNVMQSPENTNPNVLRSQLQNIGGSGGNFVVTANYDDSVGGWKADKTFSEILSALNSGENVILINHGEYVFSIAAFSNSGLKFVNINMDEITFANMSSDETFDVRMKRMSLTDM